MMEIGFCKKTRETKDLIIKLMPYELRYKKIFLNIGNANSTEKEHKGYLILNSNKAVKKSVDKKQMFRIFKKNKINCVKFIDFETILGKLKAIGYLLIGRDLVLREQGLNIIGLSQFINFFKSKSYATIKENKVIEYRVVVFKNKILKVMIKLPKKNDFTLKLENCKYINMETTLLEKTKFKDMVINSVKCLGLDLAGVDVLINSKGNLKILEVNSGMGLGKESIRRLFEELKGITK